MSILARTDAVSPHELARTQGQFTGEISVAAFPRLRSLVLGDGRVAVGLSFARDEHDRCRVSGAARATLQLQCQRCLAPVPRELDVPIDLCVVGSDAQADELPDAVEPFVLSEESVSIVDLIEDDLLLALPSQVCAEYDACANRPETHYPLAATRGAQREGAERTNPFSVLADLKNRRNF